MNKCIYNKKDDSEATFSSAEHIFPKCIGGKGCLPKGMVSDETNNYFSKLELMFTRENPAIVINRMFSRDVGRRRHKNREKIGIFRYESTGEYSLGYISDCRPYPINQLIIYDLNEDTLENVIKFHIILSANGDLSNKEKIASFLEDIKSYNSSPHCIKDDKIPENQYILGKKDNKWYLGVNKKVNPELIKPLIIKALDKLLEHEYEIKSNNDIKYSSSQVCAHFQYAFDINDIMRVYAKIAFNAFATLNPHEYLLDPKFDKIRNAVLTGENIKSLVSFALDKTHCLKPTLKMFENRITLGKLFHSVVFVSKDGIIYAIVSLYGSDYPIRVQIGEADKHYVDMFVCDWENNKEYKMNDLVLTICEHDEMEYYCGQDME